MANEKLDGLTKINDICLFVKDFDKALKFYVEKFGFKVKRLQPDSIHPNYAEFVFHGTAVTLWQVDGAAEAIGREVLGDEGHHFMIAVKVNGIGTVDEIYNELIGNGVECVREPVTYEFGSRAAYFKDCEGNIWEVFAWVEGNGPGLLGEENE